jgi:hypothetical protein
MSATMIEQIKGFHRARAVFALVFNEKGFEIVPLKRERLEFSAPMDSPCNYPTLVEWSHSQGGLHIEGLLSSMRRNRYAFLMNRGASYIPLALCHNDDEAHAICDKLREARARVDAAHEEYEGRDAEHEPEDEENEG